MNRIGPPLVNQAIKNIVPMKKKESEEKRANMDVESRRQLEELERMVAEEKAYQKRLEADQIATKIARGEHVTNAERQQLQGVNSEKLAKAEQANMQRKALSAQLKNVTSKEQADALLLSGKMTASKIIEKGEKEFGELLLAAVDKAEEEYRYPEKKQTDLPAADPKLVQSLGEKSSSIDVQV